MQPVRSGLFSSRRVEGLRLHAVGDNVAIARNCTIIGLANIEIGDNVRIDAFKRLAGGGGGCASAVTSHFCTSVMVGGAARGGRRFQCCSPRGALFSAPDDFNGEWMASCNVPDECTNRRSRRSGSPARGDRDQRDHPARGRDRRGFGAVPRRGGDAQPRALGDVLGFARAPGGASPARRARDRTGAAGPRRRGLGARAREGRILPRRSKRFVDFRAETEPCRPPGRSQRQAAAMRG